MTETMTAMPMPAIEMIRAKVALDQWDNIPNSESEPVFRPIYLRDVLREVDTLNARTVAAEAQAKELWAKQCETQGRLDFALRTLQMLSEPHPELVQTISRVVWADNEALDEQRNALIRTLLAKAVTCARWEAA